MCLFPESQWVFGPRCACASRVCVCVLFCCCQQRIMCVWYNTTVFFSNCFSHRGDEIKKKRKTHKRRYVHLLALQQRVFLHSTRTFFKCCCSAPSFDGGLHFHVHAEHLTQLPRHTVLVVDAHHLQIRQLCLQSRIAVPHNAAFAHGREHLHII